jgi:peptide/nickel transport system permease protein
VLTYLLRRLLFAVALVFTVSSGSLLLTRLAPGDYASQALGIGANRERLAEMRAKFGLDRSLVAQYRDWIAGTLRFDFGRSLAYDRPVSDLIPQRAANTAILAVTALAIATLVGVPLGIVSGSRPGGVLPGLIRAASVVLLSMPPLLTSLSFVFIAARTGWFPIGGMQSGTTGSAAVIDLLHHLVVPALALALPLAAMFERLQSEAIHQVVGQPYVVAALARGVPRTRVVWRGAFKAALGPVASVYGLVVGSLLSGSFVVEMITTWPGLGLLTLEALRARDVYLVAGCAATGSVFLACGTLLSDVALALVDPRARD